MPDVDGAEPAPAAHVAAVSREFLFAGQPATELRLACGDRAVVLHQGAQVVSWVAQGRERLYLSPRARLDGESAIRGGIPVCFPQFNQRGSLPKHGFVRNLPWTVMTVQDDEDGMRLDLRLQDSARTRVWWDQSFDLRLVVWLRPDALEVQLAVLNTDVHPLCFTGALHTYLAVGDVAQARLFGLGGCTEWNALTDRRTSAQPELRFHGEFDRVYSAAYAGYELQDGAQSLLIEQDVVDWFQTVVWNPGAEKCLQLSDMPADGWQSMLCVEAAQVDEPICIEPGDFWQGGQRLRVL